MVRDGEACNAMGSTAECNPLKIGRKLVAAGYCMYSSSTILVLTMGDGTYDSRSLVKLVIATTTTTSLPIK